MFLTIASLKGKQFEGEVRSLNIPTTSGEITVLDHHRPIITLLAAGAVTVTAVDGKETTVPLKGGFLEMDAENHLKVLID